MKYLIAFLCIFQTASFLECCTGLKLTAKDGSVVHGRTLEFGIIVDSSVAVIPRDFEFTGYKSKYAAVGAIAFGHPSLLDGMNEKGLSIGTFYFPGFASYAKGNGTKDLTPIDFPNYILTTCASLDDVRAAVKQVSIVGVASKGWGDTPPPFHYVVYDKKGDAIVIEPIDGKLVVHENPLGVMTNSPTFDWHMLNLRNYINLTPWNVKPITLNGVTLSPFSQGSGMVGMPGDFTSPSRFVRAAIFSTTALPSDNASAAVLQAFHILNQFDIPAGVVKEKANGVVASDTTQVTCVRDPSSLKYYFKTYDDQAVKVVDLSKFDLNAKAIKQASTSSKEAVQDITNLLK